mmetsp:Transcript_15952/g.37808  ORF Transcript_15952/g.37808 Transcript_15952/m.37808 type:complete len:201 (-) Transcript_15952:2498-3100(-)
MRRPCPAAPGRAPPSSRAPSPSGQAAPPRGAPHLRVRLRSAGGPRAPAGLTQMAPSGHRPQQLPRCWLADRALPVRQRREAAAGKAPAPSASHRAREAACRLHASWRRRSASHASAAPFAQSRPRAARFPSSSLSSALTCEEPRPAKPAASPCRPADGLCGRPGQGPPAAAPGRPAPPPPVGKPWPRPLPARRSLPRAQR